MMDLLCILNVVVLFSFTNIHYKCAYKMYMYIYVQLYLTPDVPGDIWEIKPLSLSLSSLEYLKMLTKLFSSAAHSSV